MLEVNTHKFKKENNNKTGCAKSMVNSILCRGISTERSGK